jgi:SAM-dependent methyltransferase
MNLLDLIGRTPVPAPWAEGEKIPWNDPDFSARMLKEHLSQEQNAASRRSERIDAHVAWIHHELLDGNPTQVLDLGCGPGLYSNRLARLGHNCVGIDYSPASIAYAVRTAQKEGLPCTFLQEYIRTATYGTGFVLACSSLASLASFILTTRGTSCTRRTTRSTRADCCSWNRLTMKTSARGAR